MNHIAIWGGERCDPIAHFLPSNINLLLDDDSWSVNEEVDAHPLKPDLQQSHEGQVFEYLVELASYFYALSTNETCLGKTTSSPRANGDSSMFPDVVDSRTSRLRRLLPRPICNHRSRTQIQQTDKRSPLPILVYPTVLAQPATRLEQDSY